MELKKYLFENRWTVTAFAKHIGYSRTHVDGIISQRLRPSIRLAKTIEQATNGHVKAEDLLKTKE